jgi:hypothetical protein
MNDWRDISTAPKDGSDVLIGGDWSYVSGVLMAAWLEDRATGEGAWLDMMGDSYNPTSWMPMPKPPTKEEIK